MGSLPLVEGERLVRALRPHPLAFLPQFSFPALLAAWAIAFLAMVGSPGVMAFAESDFLLWYREPAPVLYATWITGLLAVAVLARLLSRGLRAPLLTLAFALLWGIAAPLVAPAHLGGALGWGTLAAALVAACVVEAHRRTHRYHVTDRRIVLEGGLWRRREATHPIARVKGLEAHQSGLGRFIGFGTLVPRTDGPTDPGPSPVPALCLFGVPSFAGVREEILALVEAAHRPPPPVPFSLASVASQPTTTLARVEEILGGAQRDGSADVDLMMEQFRAAIHED